MAHETFGRPNREVPPHRYRYRTRTHRAMRWWRGRGRARAGYFFRAPRVTPPDMRRGAGCGGAQSAAWQRGGGCLKTAHGMLPGIGECLANPRSGALRESWQKYPRRFRTPILFRAGRRCVGGVQAGFPPPFAVGSGVAGGARPCARRTASGRGRRGALAIFFPARAIFWPPFRPARHPACGPFAAPRGAWRPAAGERRRKTTHRIVLQVGEHLGGA